MIHLYTKLIEYTITLIITNLQLVLYQQTSVVFCFDYKIDFITFHTFNKNSSTLKTKNRTVISLNNILSLCENLNEYAIAF